MEVCGIGGEGDDKNNRGTDEKTGQDREASVILVFIFGSDESVVGLEVGGRRVVILVILGMFLFNGGVDAMEFVVLRCEVVELLDAEKDRLQHQREPKRCIG